MKKYITLLLVLTVTFGYAQTPDTVITDGGVNDVYYSFSNGEVASVDRTTWDIGFTTAGFDASIIINESAGVELFPYYQLDTTEWDNIDTTGKMWANAYNSEETWSEGAFANLGTSHPDYGWGTYNSMNHNINGTKIFILKNKSGDYQQIMISQLNVSGLFTVKIGDIGGANSSYFTIDKKDAAYAAKNFILYNTESLSVVNSEPDSDSWDLLFTKYTTLIQAGPNLVAYTVGGIKVNVDYEVAERSGVATSSNDTSSLTWSTEITEIGSDWKVFNNNTFEYDITEDLTYFVRTAEGAVWKIYFTEYVGGAEAGYYFNIENIVGGASVKTNRVLLSSVYPNPSNGSFTVENNDDDVASLSIINLYGAEVYSNTVLPKTTLQVNQKELAKGVYTLLLTSEKAQASQKIIIE